MLLYLIPMYVKFSGGYFRLSLPYCPPAASSTTYPPPFNLAGEVNVNKTLPAIVPHTYSQRSSSNFLAGKKRFLNKHFYV
jgi:hypothetical protein